MRHAKERTTHILDRLRSGARTPSGLSVPTIATTTETGFGPVRLAVGENGEARLLLPLGSRERAPPSERTEALRVGAVTYTVDARPSPFLELVCLEPHLESLFAEIVDEIRKRISDGRTCSEACRSTLEDYRTLLNEQSESEVSVETAAGLIAELLLLERLLKMSSLAWMAWRGPLKDRHDFRAASTAIEVKAGLRRHSRRVRISSIEQLVPPSGGELFLWHYQLEQTAGGRLNVSDLVDSCCSLAGSRIEVRRLLSEVGCADPHAPEWNRFCFNNEETLTFMIDDRFPRIVPASFQNNTTPPGVLDLEYVIDLGHPGVSPLTSAAEGELLERIVACLMNT